MQRVRVGFRVPLVLSDVPVKRLNFVGRVSLALNFLERATFFDTTLAAYCIQVEAAVFPSISKASCAGFAFPISELSFCISVLPVL